MTKEAWLLICSQRDLDAVWNMLEEASSIYGDEYIDFESIGKVYIKDIKRERKRRIKIKKIRLIEQL